MFHMLGEPRSPLVFPPSTFRDGLRRLSEDGYRSVDLVEAAGLVRAGAGFPPGSLVLTFDDALGSVVDVALPLFEELGWTATVFATTGILGGTTPQGWPVADAGALRELQAAGLSIGAHTVSHPDLSRSPTERVRTELRDGKERLEDLLGAPVSAFAYPFGRYDRRSRDIAAELYVCACTDRLRFARAGDDPWLLPRVETWYLSEGGRLARLGSKRVSVYLAARRVPRNLRRAVSGSPV